MGHTITARSIVDVGTIIDIDLAQTRRNWKWNRDFRQFEPTGEIKATENLNLSLNVIYENGVFLAVFYYPLLVECIIVLFFRNINC